MKRGKFLKRASLVALSAVMVCGVAMAAAGCGGGGGGGGGSSVGYRPGLPGQSKDDAKTLTVAIFCNESDTATNQQICNEWRDAYNAAHPGANISVRLSTNTDKDKYFNDLNDWWSQDYMTDVYYLAPRYVRSYAETGRVLNLADYVDTVSADPALTGSAIKEANSEAFGQIWSSALSYYGYQRGKKQGSKYTYQLGQGIHYDAAQNGFYTDAGNEEVGLYGLPKDYSTFATGFNKLFFTDAMKKALTTTLPTQTRTVNGPTGEGTGELVSARKYTGDSGKGPKKSLTENYGVSTYAVTGQYTNKYKDGDQTMQATEGAVAPLINIGVPTTYFPFNFFRFNTYAAALAGGDPLALLCDHYTDGKGYTVTIPGFPDETFEITDKSVQDDNAPYDTSMGHITYTYAEYSALIWAMTFYLNTFDWQPINGGVADGYGGIPVVSGNSTTHRVVYGGEQYEGTLGSPLYLLPWLYANDADLIDAESQYCIAIKKQQDGTGKMVEIDNMSNLNIQNPEDWRDVAGDWTNTVVKKNLDGTNRNAEVQFGFNSQNFIETYGAFLALSSDWNGNDYGDTDDSVTNNGWSYFRAGRCIFYGAGSWDAATRNESLPTTLEFGQVPTPVAEKYALYSSVKGANYEMVTYSNGATAKGTGDGANNDGVQRTNLADGKKIYSENEIVSNQILRQDKWAARMDSVGFAVNGQVTNYTGDQAWKTEAAVSLVMALTINRDAQTTLTYAGAQFPNFRDQMTEFFDYQKYPNGAFKDMLTPEGFSDMQYYNGDGSVNATVAAQAKTIWDEYYKVAIAMGEAAAVANSQGSTQTVKQYLDTNYATVAGQAIRYNHDFDNTLLRDFVGEGTSRLAYAMKVLNMVTLTRSDRDLILRTQYGLNAVRDSTMYTFNSNWLGSIDARQVPSSMYAYRKQAPITLSTGNKLTGITRYNPADSVKTFMTPAVYCFTAAKQSYDLLLEAIASENSALAGT